MSDNPEFTLIISNHADFSSITSENLLVCSDTAKSFTYRAATTISQSLV